jgi:hypothetical protein
MEQKEQTEYTEEFIEVVKNETIKHLKKMRNKILLETDKYLIPDYPITPENLIIVKEYRQALRDFTLNNYILPDKPDFVITMN